MIDLSTFLPKARCSPRFVLAFFPIVGGNDNDVDDDTGGGER